MIHCRKDRQEKTEKDTQRSTEKPEKHRTALPSLQTLAGNAANVFVLNIATPPSIIRKVNNALFLLADLEEAIDPFDASSGPPFRLR